MSSTSLTGSFSMHITGKDYGCGVDQILITLNEEIESIKAEDLEIKETKQNTDWTSPTFEIIVQSSMRTIQDAYLSDEKGNKVDGNSKYITVTMNIDPIEGSPLLFCMRTQYNTYADPYLLDITLKEGVTLKNGDQCFDTLKIDPQYTSKTSNADVFKIHSGNYEGVEYGYVTYTPAEKSETLVVWLHGLGEGGKQDFSDSTDAYISILGNRVTALAEKTFQSTVGGAHILAPQCPTYWMDTLGDSSNFQGGMIKATRDSYFTKSLVALIDDYAQKVQAKKIVICGCSNGGYMAMNLAMNYGNKYDAYVPICEAMANAEITDQDIEVLKDLPMYFVYSKDDPVVVPSLHEIPTIERLQKAGAKNLEVSVTEHVVDLSGEYAYLSEEGPYTYMGHWSWIYFYNNQTCSENGISAFDWIANIVK